MPGSRLDLIAGLRAEIAASEPDDPATLDARLRLARVYRDCSEDDDHQAWEVLAAAELALVVAGRSRILGADHPDTLAVRYEFALVTYHSGDEAGGVELLRAVADERERVLGWTHPDTLRAWGSLGFLDPSPPAGLGARVLAGWEQVVAAFPEDTAESLGARQQLMMEYSTAGREADRIASVTRIVAGWERLATERAERLGVVHPETTYARQRHAYAHRWFRDQDQSVEVGLVAAIADDHVRLLGPAHPDTLQAQVALAFRCFEGAADTPRAVALATDIIDAVADLPDKSDLRLLRAILTTSHAAAGNASAAFEVMTRYPLPDDT